MRFGLQLGKHLGSAADFRRSLFGQLPSLGQADGPAIVIAGVHVVAHAGAAVAFHHVPAHHCGSISSSRLIALLRLGIVHGSAGQCKQQPCNPVRRTGGRDLLEPLTGISETALPKCLGALLDQWPVGRMC